MTTVLQRTFTSHRQRLIHTASVLRYSQSQDSTDAAGPLAGVKVPTAAELGNSLQIMLASDHALMLTATACTQVLDLGQVVAGTISNGLRSQLMCSAHE